MPGKYLRASGTSYKHFNISIFTLLIRNDVLPRPTGAVLAARSESVSEAICSPFQRLWSELDNVSPTLGRHPGLGIATLAAAGLGGSYYYSRYHIHCICGLRLQWEPEYEVTSNTLPGCVHRLCSLRFSTEFNSLTGSSQV